MTLAQLVTDYGYPALAVGCLLEGETIVLLAGLAAHRGLLAWPMVMLIATGFSFLGDQFWYQIGRRYGKALIERFPLLAERRPWLEQRLFAHPDARVLGVRFMGGLRTVGPILMGSGFVQPRRFFWLNLLGALLWVCTFVSAGYFFGEIAQRLLPDIRVAEEALFGVLLLAGLALQLFRHWHKKPGVPEQT